MTGIYIITNLINGKNYIGQAVNIEDRIKTHFYHLKKNNHNNNKMQIDFNEYGDKCFKYEILEECEEDKLNCLENYYVHKYDSIQTGYNIANPPSTYSNRKQNNKPSIYTRMRKNGTYEARFYLEHKLKSTYGKTIDEAVSKAKKILQSDDKNDVINKNEESVNLHNYNLNTINAIKDLIEKLVV